jgi:hypothetical protein
MSDLKFLDKNMVQCWFLSALGNHRIRQTFAGWIERLEAVVPAAEKRYLNRYIAARHVPRLVGKRPPVGFATWASDRYLDLRKVLHEEWPDITYAEFSALLDQIVDRMIDGGCLEFVDEGPIEPSAGEIWEQTASLASCGGGVPSGGRKDCSGSRNERCDCGKGPGERVARKECQSTEFEDAALVLSLVQTAEKFEFNDLTLVSADTCLCSSINAGMPWPKHISIKSALVRRNS